MRLLGVVLAIGMMSFAVPAQAVDGYLAPRELPAIADWLAPPPATGSVREAADLNDYFATREQLAEPRGAEATRDNVYDPKDVIRRFDRALGFTLNSANAPLLIAMMDRVMRDEEATLRPVKRPVSEGGRLRPYVRFSSLPACPHQKDDEQWHLAESGSYPSGHAMLAWTWALLLAEAVPDRADQIMAEGYQFGQSRLVCGFHFPSDLEGGRYAASALVARLHAQQDFIKDWARARREISRVRKRQPKP